MDLKTYLKAQAKAVDTAMNGYLPKASQQPKTIHEAMRYVVLKFSCTTFRCSYSRESIHG